MIRIRTEFGGQAMTTITMRTPDDVEAGKERVFFNPGMRHILDRIRLGDSVVIYLTRNQSEELFADMVKVCTGTKIEEEASDE